MKNIKVTRCNEIKSDDRKHSMKFEMEYENRQIFDYTLTKEVNSEWVLQGDNKARYCRSELKLILKQLKMLNSGKTSKKLMKRLIRVKGRR